MEKVQSFRLERLPLISVAPLYKLLKTEIMNIKMYKNPGLFFTLSTAFPWTLWFIAAYISHAEPGSVYHANLSSILAFAGLIAPIAVILHFVYENRELAEDISGRIFNFKGIKIRYILLTCLLMLSSIILAQAVSLVFGYSSDQFRLAESFSFTSGVFPVWFLLIAAPVMEEFAWHSYGTDSLRSRFNLFKASLIFAMFWGIWHFPLSFIKDYYHSNLVEEGWIYSANFILSLFPFVIIINWIYYKTNRNILLPVIFHITSGFFNESFATHPMSKLIQTVLLLLFSVYLILHDKKMFFTKSYEVPALKKPFRLSVFTKSLVAVIIILVTQSSDIYSQSFNQTVRGKVYDNLTQEALPFSTILILNTDPVIGTMADLEGNFEFKNIAPGRLNIRVDMIGYESYIVSEIMVSSGKEVVLNIGLQQSSTELEELVVKVSKETPLNSMSLVSARQFTVEETQRYAGGLDDPARLVASFAGVASPSISSSGISVRGNNPSGLLWKIEGVEVPNPNHFADLTIAGGGMLTAISSQMMGNSDFFTGAFPAEYGNASSGVFDIKLNTGNSAKRQYTFQAGILGVDFATQGPFVAGKNATYTMNYRYSTMALLAPVLPSDAGVLKYQDLSFKTNFPTKKAGTFSLWGIGTLDGVDMKAIERIYWETDTDRDNSETDLNMFASGLSHKISLNSSTFLSTTISATGNGVSFNEQRLNYSMQSNPQSKAENQLYRFAFQSAVSKRFGNNHSNKTGFNYQYLGYNMDIQQSLSEGNPLVQMVNQDGNSGLLQVYSQSKINLKPRLKLNLGINAQYFLLNNNFSVEPRAGIKYDMNNNHSIAFAYGLHSRIEQLPVYFIEVAGSQPNKNLKFMKSAHYVFSYSTKLNDNMRFTVEPYFQKLNNIPVSPDSYISIINNDNALFFHEILCSEGKGRNIGIDLSLERYLNKGFYYLLTGSLFDSKYTAKDGIERNTRYNRNLIFNIAAGKEWIVGRNKNKILGINARYNYLGGNRIEPVNTTLSLQNKKVIYGETNGNLAFEEKFDANPVFSFTISYRKNKAKYSSVWFMQVLNANKSKEFSGNSYNFSNSEIDTNYEGIMIPNIGYKIEF